MTSARSTSTQAEFTESPESSGQPAGVTQPLEAIEQHAPSNAEVRVSPVAINPLVPFVVRNLGKIMPRTVGRYAARVWCRPPVPQKKIVLKGGVTENVSGIAAQVWGSGPLVYLAHGWGGYRGHFEAIVPALVAAGYRVVAFDAPSQGESAPGVMGKNQSSVYEMADALKRVVTHYGDPHAVIAHSLGGAAASLAIAQGIPTKNAVLIAPASDAFVFTRVFAQAFGLGDASYDHMVKGIESATGRSNWDANVPRALASAAGELPPALIFSDRNDKEVNFADGIEISQAWANSRHVLTHGLGHRRILKDESVLGQIVEFLAD